MIGCQLHKKVYVDHTYFLCLKPSLSLEAHALLYAVGPTTRLVLQAVRTLTEAAFLIALARESGGRLTVDTR